MGQTVKNTEILTEETAERLQETTWLTDESRKRAANNIGFGEHSFKRVADDAHKNYELLEEHGKYANTYTGTCALDQGQYFN